jgi:hypothetical protein
MSPLLRGVVCCLKRVSKTQQEKIKTGCRGHLMYGYLLASMQRGRGAGKALSSGR